MFITLESEIENLSEITLKQAFVINSPLEAMATEGCRGG